VLQAFSIHCVIVFLGFSTVYHYQWQELIGLFFLLVLNIFLLVPGIKNVSLKDLLRSLTLMFLSLQIPPEVLTLQPFKSPLALFELVHTVLAWCALVILVYGLCKGHKSESEAEAFYESAFLLMFLVLLGYGSMVIVMGKFMNLPAALNPRLFYILSSALFFFYALKFRGTVRLIVRHSVAVVLIIVLSIILVVNIHLVLSINTLYNSALEARSNNQADKARDQFQAVIRLNQHLGWRPWTLLSLKYIGAFQLATNRTSQAQSTFKKSLELRGNDPEALFGLALCLYANNNFAEALAYLEKIAKTHVSLSSLQHFFQPPMEIMKRLAIMLKEEGKLIVAQEILLDLVDRGSVDGEVDYHLGDCYARGGQAELAARQYTKSVQSGFRSPELLFRLAEIELKAHNHELALDYALRIPTLSTRFSQGYDLLEKIYATLNNPEQAAQFRDARRQFEPTHPLALRTKNLELLGFSIKDQDLKQGDVIDIYFFSRLLTDCDHNYEPIYLLSGKAPYYYQRFSFNLLEHIVQEKGTYFRGDVIISRCSVNTDSYLPGFCDISFFLPGDTRLDRKMKFRKLDEVDNEQFHHMTSLSLRTHIYHMRLYSADQLKHIVDPQLDQKSLQVYFLLGNRYSVTIPMRILPERLSVTSVILISALSFSEELDQGEEFARIIMRDKDDKEYTWQLRAGEDSSEWAWDNPGMRFNHHRAKVAVQWKQEIQGRQFVGNKYYSQFDFSAPVHIVSMKMQYRAALGCVEVCDILLQGVSSQQKIKMMSVSTLEAQP